MLGGRCSSAQRRRFSTLPASTRLGVFLYFGVHLALGAAPPTRAARVSRAHLRTGVGCGRASRHNTQIFTQTELLKFDGTDENLPLYLVVVGQVYDVSNGRQYYSKGEGYNIFAGKDCSRAFVTGEFDANNRTADAPAFHDIFVRTVLVPRVPQPCAPTQPPRAARSARSARLPPVWSWLGSQATPRHASPRRLIMPRLGQYRISRSISCLGLKTGASSIARAATSSSTTTSDTYPWTT